MLKIAIYGANTRSIALASRELKKDVKVSVIFDKDVLKQGKCTEGGTYSVDGDRVYCGFAGVIIDDPGNWRSYDFDYVVIFAGSVNAHIQNRILENLQDLGIEPNRIIKYSRHIGSGVVKVERLENFKCSFELLMRAAADQNIDQDKYLYYAEELLEVSNRIFNNRFRLFLLELLVKAIRATVKQGYIEYYDLKMDYEAFASNPSLFLYECSDIFIDAYPGEMQAIEYIEGPYFNGRVKVEKNDIVIDAGANCGMFSALAATKTSNTVYAFEPIKKTVELLKKTTQLYPNIKVVPMALGASTREALADISNYESNQGGVSVMKSESSSKVEVVQMISLDEFAERNELKKIDFIKADVEGAERLLLFGAKKVLSGYAPKLSICTYHFPEDKALLEFLIKQSNPDYVIEHAYQKLYAYVK